MVGAPQADRRDRQLPSHTPAVLPVWPHAGETSSGEQGEIGPGDVAAIEPGHDAWVVGDEPCVSVDFGGYAQYAKG